MNFTGPTASASPPLAASARERRSLAGWHAAWLAGAAAIAGWSLSRGGLDAAMQAALALTALPGLAGLWLARRDDLGARLAAMALWAVAAVAVSALTGGMTGPFAALVFAPMTAGVALGRKETAAAGAAAGLLAAPAGLISVALVGPGPFFAGLAAALAMLTAAAGLWAGWIAWRTRERRLTEAETTARRLGGLLANQAGLTLTLSPTGQTLAAYGSPPSGISIDTLFKEGVAGAADPSGRDPVLNLLSRAVADGRDHVLVFAPREARDRRARLTLRREDGRVIARLDDATAQYARELELESARADAEAREAGKTRFLANMSHELRTPLNAVLGFSDIMRQRIFGPIPDRYAEYADNIHQAGGHLLDLINDVLDVSKIEAERYTLTKEKFDARDPVSAAAALVRVGSEDKGVRLSVVLPSRALEVEADERALKQITLNLLSNAVKFTAAGGSVTLTLDRVEGELELVVSDTGVGIAADDVTRLGKPFEQAGDADQRRQGTGLGLSLVRAFAELHGGRMTIDSTLGEGTAMTVRMPVLIGEENGGAQIIPLPRKGA